MATSAAVANPRWAATAATATRTQPPSSDRRMASWPATRTAPMATTIGARQPHHQQHDVGR